MADVTRTGNEDNATKHLTERYMFDTYLIKEFLDCVKEGNLEKIQKYIEKYSLDVKFIKDSHFGHNALFYAALIKDDENALNVMRFLVNIGIDPMYKDTINQTVLYYVCREGKFQCTKFLVERGCSFNEKDLYLQTPIFYAAREGKLDIVEFLVNHNADLNIEDKFGQNVLFYAIQNGHEEIVKFLAEKGVNINKVDKKRLTPLTFAYKHNRTSIAELLIELGAQDNKDIANDKKKKQKKNGNESENNENKIDNKLRKYVLVRIVDGEKRVLTSRELEEFKKTYPEVADLLFNQKAIEELETNAPEALKTIESWEKVAKRLMSQLWKVKDSEIFHRPVDPIELGIPDYTDIVKRPMDFSTIKKKLGGNLYVNCREFVDDIELVFYNCFLYNGDQSVIGIICNNIKNEYKKLFDQLNIDIFL